MCVKRLFFFTHISFSFSDMLSVYHFLAYIFCWAYYLLYLWYFKFLSFLTYCIDKGCKVDASTCARSVEY